MITVCQCGIFDSKIAFPGVTFTRERITETYEIELYLSGSGYSGIDGVAYAHKPGSIIFCRPGQRRYSYLPFSCICLHLQAEEELRRYLEEFPPQFTPSDPQNIEKKIMEIVTLCKSDGEELLTQAKIYDFFCTLLRESRISRMVQKNCSRETALQACSYMDTHFSQPICLEDISKSVNLSPIYFHKLFTGTIGVTPREYLFNRRIEHAKILLLTGERSLSEISDDCGFSSQSYFQTQFKKATGFTPRQYRKRRYIRL